MYKLSRQWAVGGGGGVCRRRRENTSMSFTATTSCLNTVEWLMVVPHADAPVPWGLASHSAQIPPSPEHCPKQTESFVQEINPGQFMANDWLLRWYKKLILLPKDETDSVVEFTLWNASVSSLKLVFTWDKSSLSSFPQPLAPSFPFSWEHTLNKSLEQESSSQALLLENLPQDGWCYGLNFVPPKICCSSNLYTF